MKKKLYPQLQKERLLCEKCINHIRNREFDKSKLIIKDIESSLFNAQNNSQLRMIFNITSGAYQARCGDPASAIRMLTNTLTQVMQHTDPWYQIETLRFLGGALSEQGNYDAAVMYYYRLIELMTREKCLEAGVFNGMGNALTLLKRFQEAEDYYSKALKYLKAVKNPLFESIIYSNLSELYADKGVDDKININKKDFIKSIKYINLAIKTLSENIDAHMRLGMNATLSYYESIVAEKYVNVELIHETIKIERKLKKFASISERLLQLSIINKVCGKLDLAIDFAEQAIEASNGADSIQKKLDAINVMSFLCEKNNDIDKSLTLLKQYTKILKDQNISLKYKSAQSEDLEVRYSLLNIDYELQNGINNINNEIFETIDYGYIIISESGRIVKNVNYDDLLSINELNIIINYFNNLSGNRKKVFQIKFGKFYIKSKLIESSVSMDVNNMDPPKVWVSIKKS